MATGLDDQTTVAPGLRAALRNGRGGTALDPFLGDPEPARALARWFDLTGTDPVRSRRDLAWLIERHIAAIDGLLNRQLNAILHHPRVQRLEAAWRGLHYLIQQVEEGSHVKVRLLSVTQKELANDLERAIEFDQSQLFRKVYNEEFGTPGGEPYGLLVGDYEIRRRPGPDSPVNDLLLLSGVAGVAAAAFAPFVAAAHPSLLGLDRFTELELPRHLTRTFEGTEYLKWRALRAAEDSRFLGLTLPRVLLREPYERGAARGEGFLFREEVGGPDHDRYLWGNAAFAFAAVVVRCFARTRWLADIRGVQPDVLGGGLVTGLPVHSFGTDRAGLAPKASTDALITDDLERELGELGFIALTACRDTEYAAFFGNQSLQRPKAYNKPAATMNARLSAMLQYILCVSRFAHYLKVIARDKIGSFAGTEECEDYLNRWLVAYTIASDTSDWETKAKFPLREAQVQVREHRDKPGSYVCVAYLRPHFQLDQLVTAVQIATELAPSRE